MKTETMWTIQINMTWTLGSREMSMLYKSEYYFFELAGNVRPKVIYHTHTT